MSIASLIPNSKPVEAHEYSEYKSDGSKFGKTAQVKNLQGGGKGFGSTEFFVLRGKKGVTDNDFVYYLSTSKEFRSREE